MTTPTPLQQGKLIQGQTSSLLPQISSYGNRIVLAGDAAKDEDRSRSSTGTIIASSYGNTCNDSNNKWIKYICQFIHAVSTIIRFGSPFVIIVAILYNLIIASAVTFGLFLSKILVLDLFLYKMGKIQNWPNKIDMIAAAVMVSFVIFSFLFSMTNMHPPIMFDIIVAVILTVSTAVAWLFEHPIGRVFVSDIVEDTVPFTHPVVIHFIQLTSGVMLCAFFLSLMLSIAEKVCSDHGEKETASAFSFFDCIVINGLVLFIWCYGFYFNTYIEKIAAKYEKEISKQMDNASYHPNNNHELTTTTTTTKLEMQAIIIHDTNTV